MMSFGYEIGILGFLGSLMMIVFMSLPLILLVWLGFYLYDRLSYRYLEKLAHKPEPSLSTKLAQGEISIDEFHKMKKL